MPVKCYTCGEMITFSDKKLSKSGKKIPLNLDESNHEHDDAGKPVFKTQTQQFNQYNRQQQQPPQQQERFQAVAQQKTAQMGTSSSGGSYMDTKRLRVMVEDLTKQGNQNTELLQSCYELCKNNNTMLGEIVAKMGLTEPTTAANIYSKQQQQQQRDPLSVNHGKIADLNEAREKTAAANKPIIDESKQEFPIVDTLTDDEDDDAEDDDDDNQGVIKEDEDL